MTFISYAQNFEDVMLYRALKHVENGFYVDVGAQQPVADSVTKAFYERGWSGINVEPVPQWHQMLCEDRPRDVNLNMAVGASAGFLRLYSVAGTGLSTADPDYAKRYREEGREVAEIDVPVQTLTQILSDYAPREIHFLKVDVEGFEREVVEGLDFHRFRPWVLVIESTLPNSSEENCADWEDRVLSSGYEFAYFDGLNRFYVAKEQALLKESFITPPNILDGFVRFAEWNGHRLALERSVELERLTARVAEQFARSEHLSRIVSSLQSALHGTQAFFDETRHALAACNAVRRQVEDHLKEKDKNFARERAWLTELMDVRHRELLRLTTSMSWRITKPLRFLNRSVRRVITLAKLFASSPLLALKTAVRFTVVRAVRFPVLRAAAGILLKSFPNVKRRLVRAVGQTDSNELLQESSPSTAITESAAYLQRLFEQVSDYVHKSGGAR